MGRGAGDEGLNERERALYSAVAALDGGLTAIALADRDFERIEHVRVFRPSDLGPLTHLGQVLSRVAA